MPSLADGPEPGRENLPEALPPADAAEIAVGFRWVVGWQVSHRMEALLLARWRDGTLRRDHRHENGCLLRMMLRELWLPTTVPREGRGR